MSDTDGAAESPYHFYQSVVFSESKGRKRVPYYGHLQRRFSLRRRKRGITLKKYVNFIRYGA